MSEENIVIFTTKILRSIGRSTLYVLLPIERIHKE
jgi:hypothetical protein